MNEPIHLLYLGPAEPDLSTSAWGPFIVRALHRREALSEALGQGSYDALVLDEGLVGPLAALAQWPPLAHAVLDLAVLVVSAEPSTADAQRLLERGVQDVLPRRDAGADGLGRAVRMAVAREALDRAARKAYATDLATGLPNHSQLMEHMTHLLALREREPATMALLALRLEGLAATERRLGAESANVLRRKAAVRLRASLRASDVVASLGDDTFVVLLAWVDAAANADRVGDKLVQALQRPFSVAGQDVALAVRLGLVQYPQHGKEATSLLGQALQAAGTAPVVGRVGLGGSSAMGAANDE